MTDINVEKLNAELIEMTDAELEAVSGGHGCPIPGGPNPTEIPPCDEF